MHRVSSVFRKIIIPLCVLKLVMRVSLGFYLPDDKRCTTCRTVKRNKDKLKAHFIVSLAKLQV